MIKTTHPIISMPIIIYGNIYANKPNIAQPNRKPKSSAQAPKNSSINV